MQLIINLLISALAVYLVAWLLPGISVKNYWAAIIVALLIAVFNVFVDPLLELLNIKADPLIIALIVLIINTLIVLLVDKLLKSFKVKGFVWALVFSIIVSVVTYLLHNLGAYIK